jgi:hypothetical protein
MAKHFRKKQGGETVKNFQQEALNLDKKADLQPAAPVRAVLPLCEESGVLDGPRLQLHQKFVRPTAAGGRSLGVLGKVQGCA